jgi:hypothetical protein
VRTHLSVEKWKPELFVASVYTEMNAVTKGVSLGIYDKDKERGTEAAANGSQPYVELMGRRYISFLHLSFYQRGLFVNS